MKAKNNSLAVTRWHCRYPNVDRPAGDFQRNATVLWESFLSNVEFRHDLDAGDDERGKGAPCLQYFLQDTAYAKAHAKPVLIWLDMNV